jgi:hypothetical protein
LPDLDYIRIDLAPDRIEGKKLLVCFFDMNQRPSRHCVQALNQRAAELAERGVFVMAVHAGTANADSLQAWVAQRDLRFPVGTPAFAVQETRYAWAVRSLPWLILTDSDRIVRAEGFAIDELDKILKPTGTQQKD